MAKKKQTWRAWAIVCEGIGPISGRVYMSKAGALIAKKHSFATNDLYKVQRVKIVLDPVKTRYW